MKMPAVLLLCLASSVASALVTRSSLLKKAAFRDSAHICLRPIDPGAGNPVTAFSATVYVCPQVDRDQADIDVQFPCSSVELQNVAATVGQKAWLKSIWSQALAVAQVPEAAADAP